MNYERKYKYVKNQLDKLIKENKSLHKRCDELVFKIKELTDLLENKDNELTDINLKFNSLKEDFKSSTEEVKLYREKYKNFYTSMINMKSQYEKQVGDLLKQMRKKTK